MKPLFFLLQMSMTSLHTIMTDGVVYIGNPRRTFTILHSSIAYTSREGDDKRDQPICVSLKRGASESKVCVE